MAAIGHRDSGCCRGLRRGADAHHALEDLVPVERLAGVFQRPCDDPRYFVGLRYLDALRQITQAGNHGTGQDGDGGIVDAADAELDAIALEVRVQTEQLAQAACFRAGRLTRSKAQFEGRLVVGDAAEVESVALLDAAQQSHHFMEFGEFRSVGWRRAGGAGGILDAVHLAHHDRQHPLHRPAGTGQQHQQVEVEGRHHLAHELLAFQRQVEHRRVFHEGIARFAEGEGVGGALRQLGGGGHRAGDLEAGRDALDVKEVERVAVAQAHQVEQQLLVVGLLDRGVVFDAGGLHRARADVGASGQQQDRGECRSEQLADGRAEAGGDFAALTG